MNRTLIALLALLTALSASAQTTRHKAKRRQTPPPAPPLVLPPAGDDQVQAAALTYFGDYACEFKQSLRLSPDTRFPSYVDVRFGKQTFTTKPVLSKTGVLRLEDVKGRVLLLQIAMKSMLMDVQAGKRLVDDCINEKQAENRRLAAGAPPQPGLGILPTSADAQADAAMPPAVAHSADSAPSAAGSSGS